MNCLMKIALMMLRQYLNLNSYYIIVIWYHGVSWSWSGVQKIFVQIAKNICPNCEMYLCKFWNEFVQIVKCICPNCDIYLSKLWDVFVQILKCICPNFEMYLSKLWKVLVQIVKCICPNCTIRVRCEDEAVSVWIGIAASQWAKDSPIFSCWATIIDAKDNNYIHYIYTIYIIHCRSICYQHRCCSSADKNVFVRFQLCNLSFHF